MPGGLVSFLPLLIPMILILSATTSKMVLPKGHPFITFTSFIGDANIAMAVGVIFAICLLGRKLKKTGEKNPILKIMDDALKSAGPIIFITAAGGALGAILKSSGAGKAIAEAVANSGMPFILVPFFIAGILKTIQGSGTVCSSNCCYTLPSDCTAAWTASNSYSTRHQDREQDLSAMSMTVISGFIQT